MISELNKKLSKSYKMHFNEKLKVLYIDEKIKVEDYKKIKYYIDYFKYDVKNIIIEI